MPIYKLKERLALEEGGYLDSAKIEYEITGKPNRDGSNVIIICHTLTGNIDVVSSKLWTFVGSEQTIDTNQYCVISLGTLGGLTKSTGPKTEHKTGEIYGPDFPTVTVTDSVRAHIDVLKSLGIKQAKAVIGGSYGGFCAYTWIALKPKFFKLAVIFQSGLCCSAHTIALFSLCRDLIVSSPHWKGGHYTEKDLGKLYQYKQMIAVNRLFQLNYCKFEEKFSRSYRTRTLKRKAKYWEPHSIIDDYITSQPSAISGIDPNTMLSTLSSSSLFDIERSFPDIWTRWEKLSTTVLQVPCRQDWRYPIEEMSETHEKMRAIGVNTYYQPTESKWGHGSYLYDPASLKQVLPLITRLLKEYE